MAKTKTAYFCQNCGAQSAKWQGQCNVCKSWNTLVEEVLEKAPASGWKGGSTDPKATKPIPVGEIRSEDEMRIPLGDPELDRVLGGGLVAGSVVFMKRREHRARTGR